MNATAVRIDRNKYERTTDLRRMLTSAELVDAIIKGARAKLAGQEPETNIFAVLPARAATSMRYDNGARTAVVWNEGGNEEKIELPLKDGWRKSDGNPFGVPNGAPSNQNDPEALYLYRRQDRAFSGPLGLGLWLGRWRYFVADDVWSVDSGVALIGAPGGGARLAESQGASEAALPPAPLVTVSKEALAKIDDPKALLQRAEQLETAAKELTERLGGVLSSDAYSRLIKPTVDEAAFLRELAGKIEAIQPKA